MFEPLASSDCRMVPTRAWRHHGVAGARCQKKPRHWAGARVEKKEL